MKELLISIFSGIVGVILTIGYQHFFTQAQSFTFIYNGKEMVVTESNYTEIMEQNNTLKNENEQLKQEYDKIDKLYIQANNQIEQLNYKIAELSQKYEIQDDNLIQEKPSTFLYEMDYMALHTPEQNFYKPVANLNDSIGINHDNAILCGAKGHGIDSDSNSLYAEYYIDKQFISLKGNIVIPDESKNCDDAYVVYFYGDDEYITQSDTITLGSLPYEFDVPVAGITKLKIKIERTERNSGNSSIAITEARFYQ